MFVNTPPGRFDRRVSSATAITAAPSELDETVNDVGAPPDRLFHAVMPSRSDAQAPALGWLADQRLAGELVSNSGARSAT